MTRPESYRPQSHKYCGDCRFLGVAEHFQRLCCFHGVDVEVGDGYIILNGSEIETLSGAYREGLNARAVGTFDTCDKWGHRGMTKQNKSPEHVIDEPTPPESNGPPMTAMAVCPQCHSQRCPRAWDYSIRCILEPQKWTPEE